MSSPDAPDTMASRISCIRRKLLPTGAAEPPATRSGVHHLHPVSVMHARAHGFAVKGVLRRLTGPFRISGEVPDGRIRHHRWRSDADRQAVGRAGGLLRRRARRVRHQGRARASRPHPRADRLRVHGSRPAGGYRPDHRPAGRGPGGHPDDRPRHHGQQGVPLGPQHHLPRRPDDPGRRCRDRRRRRHGVDDPGPVPPPPGPGRLPLRRRHARRLVRLRRPLLRLRQGRDGWRDGEVRRHPPTSPASRRTSSPRSRTSGPRPPSRTASSPTRSSRSRSRSGRATRSCSTPTKASARARPSSHSPACVPRSTRRATSPRATRRRSPTAAAP